MSIAFKKMTRSLAWIMTASLAVAFMLPSSAAAIEFFPSPFRYQWKSQSGTIEGNAHVVRANAGDTAAMSLTITNRSIDPKALTIYGKSALLPEVSPYQGAHELRLGTSNPHDKMYDWVDAGSFISNPDGAANRLAVYDGAAVNPGGDLTFNFNLKIKAGTADGTYDFYVGVVREFDAWARQVDSAGRLLAGEDIFWRVIVGTGTTTPATGGLSVALASGTPAAANVADAGNANMTKFTLTAAAGVTVKVTQIFVTRDGLTADSDIENIKLLRDDGTQVGGTAGGFNANHKAQIYITPGLEITGSQDFYIRAGVIDGATSGKTVRLGVSVNADIISNATAVTGAPVYGNYMTIVQVTIGSITLAEDGSVTDTTPDVGDTDVITDTFKLTAGSTEAITVDRITTIKAGTSETSDTVNIELWDVTNNKTLGTAANWTADGKASFPVDIKLAKGDTIRLRVQLDIVDGVGLTTNTDMSDGSDALIFAKGDSYGFYITPTYSSSTWNGQGDAPQTINAGSLTISKSASTPGTGNITQADGQLITVWDFDVRGESMRISAISIDLTFVDDFAYTDITNARLVDMATGNVLAGPVDGTTDGSAALNRELDFTSTFVLPVAVTKVGIKIKVANTAADDGDGTADTISAAVTAAGDVTTKGLITNNTITPGGSYAVTGNTQTIKVGALVVRTLGNPPTGNIIVGTQDYTWSTFSFDATASGEDVLVSAVTVTDTLDGTTADMADVDNAELWADLDNNGSYETKISNTETPAGGGGASDTQAFTFSQAVRVPKGSSVKWIFLGDLAAGGYTGTTETHALTVAADGATVTGADTGNTITDTASGSAGTLTVTESGSVTIAVDGASPASAIMLAGTTGNVIAKYKFTAVDEAFRVDLINLKLTNWNANGLDQWDSIKNLIIEYPRQDGTVGTKSSSPSTTNLVFDNLDMYIPKNGNAVLTIKADFWNIASESADFGDQIEVALDYGDAGDGTDAKATGLSSGVQDKAWGSADVQHQTHVLYKTLITVTKDTSGLTSTLVPGTTNTLYRFKLTTDSRGNAGLKRLTFAVSVSDNTNSINTVNVGGFTILRDSTDITASRVLIAGLGGLTGSVSNSAVAARASMETKGTNDAGGTGSGSGALGTVTTWVHVMFGDASTEATRPETGEESLTAGGTTTWTFTGQTGAGFVGAEDDSVSVELLGDTTAPTDGYFEIGDDDVTDDEYSIVIVLGSAGTTDTTDVEFIWTDMSAISHTGAMSDNAGTVDTTPDSSADWANGWLIKNFPLGAHSLIA